MVTLSVPHTYTGSDACYLLLVTSPAVSNFGLRYCAVQAHSDEFWIETGAYMIRSFYVDEGLYCTLMMLKRLFTF